MTEPGRIRDHAQAAGFGTTDDYALELEDVIEGIVDRRPVDGVDLRPARHARRADARPANSSTAGTFGHDRRVWEERSLSFPP